MYDQRCPDYDNTILCYGQDLALSNFTYTSWHKYGIEWTPTIIIWYIDDLPVRTMIKHGIIDPVRIILNMTIEPGYLPNSSTSFPSEMLVDSVKVYDLKKKSITIGNGSCTNSLNVGQNIFLRASESVLINGDFTVPVGSEIYMDVNPCY